MINKNDIQKPTGGYNPKSFYVLGADLARTGKDETAIVILEKLPFNDNIFLVYMECYHTPNLTSAIGRIQYLNTVFHFKKIIIDETGLGAGVSDILKEKLGGIVEGVWYTQKMKVELFNNLKLLMGKENGRLFIPDYLQTNLPEAKKLYFQLLSIKQEHTEGSFLPKISHETGEHDDLVNALALASRYFGVKSDSGKKHQYNLAGGKSPNYIVYH